MSAQTPSAPTAPRLQPGRGQHLRLLWGLAAAVLLLDQLTKVWALGALADGVRRPLLGSLLGLRLVFNPGAAFSFATGQTWLLTVVALAVVVFVLRVSRRLGSRAWTVALALVLGGAVGNLVDRLLRAPGVGRGHVVDFIDYGVFVGNVADIAIVVAAALIMWLSVTGRELEGEAAASAAGTGSEAAGEALGQARAEARESGAPGAQAQEAQARGALKQGRQA